MLNKILDFFFPKSCLGCGKAGSYFCLECTQKNSTPVTQVCPVCERPSLHGLTHYKCRTRLSLDGFLYGFNYKNEIRRAIGQLKFKPYTFAAASELVTLLLKQQSFKQELDVWLKMETNPLLVPVPLHWFRFSERGYNQSEILAKNLGKNLGIPVQNLLKRTVLTPSQRGLTAQKRKENVADIFAVKQNFSPLTAKCSMLILVDDVWTTGSTLKSCGKVLKEGGFKKVYAVTLAR